MIGSRMYFAFADNMDEKIVRKICPGVSFEGVAELRDHKFILNNLGKATIVEAPNSSVWGVVWCLSCKDIYRLDKKEQDDLGVFEKLNKTVQLLDGKIVEAFLYLTPSTEDSLPNPDLLEHVVEQATFWSLPHDYINYLKSLAA